jgi:ERCC4-type nuclease
MKEEIVVRWRKYQQQHQSTHNISQSPLLFPTNAKDQTKILSQKEFWMSLKDLIPKIDARLRPECPGKLKRYESDNGAAHYMEASTRSAEFKQIEKLCSKQATVEHGVAISPEMRYLKSHSVKKQRYFELTSLGYSTAQRIRTRTFPTAVGHYRCSNLEAVDPKYDGVCLAVDMREGGGQKGKKTLHEMCNALDKVGIPYFVGTLAIGDYCFFSGNQLCPILVERKSVQDLAQSIHDQRMSQQKQRMYRGQFVFGYDNCRIAIIVEGKVEKQQVTGGYIGSAKFGVTKEQFDKEMETLEAEGFDVLRTTRAENSMFELNRWAQRVAKEVQSGKLKLQYTYNEFIDEVNKIPAQTDFSRLAKYHASEKKKAAVDQARAENTISLLDSDDEDSATAVSQHRGRARELPPNNLDLKFASVKRTAEQSNGMYRATAKRPKVEDKKSCGVEYEKLSAAQLRAKCVGYGLPKSGNKDDLINRLLKPRPPEIYRIRKKRGLYVPSRLDTSPTALLVAIQIFQDSAASNQSYVGHTKDEIYVLAEALDIKKDPFSGGTTQTGPYRKSVN